MLINYWHSILHMPKRDLDWHRQDMADELAEYRQAQGLVNYWSELSDVVYTYTRGRWSGHRQLVWPLNYWQFSLGLIYMFPKYTLRWLFFRRVGRRVDSTSRLTEVRNPDKIHKLVKIAENNQLDPDSFVREVKILRRWWVLLK